VHHGAHSFCGYVHIGVNSLCGYVHHDAHSVYGYVQKKSSKKFFFQYFLILIYADDALYTVLHFTLFELRAVFT